MTIDEAKQAAIAFIKELRKIREGAIIGDFTKGQVQLLMSTKLKEFEEDFCAKQWPFSDAEIGNFFQVIKWHYWNILYSLFGDAAESIMPEFKRDDVPIMLPGIGIFFEEDSETQPPAQGEAAVPILTDTECIQKLVDTGFIAQNANIKNKVIYAKTRAVTAPKIYRELLKITGDGERAERIMRNNISGIEAGLKQYLSRLAKQNVTKSNIP